MTKSTEQTFEFPVLKYRAVDGDTLEATLDLGFYLTITQRFRLRGINAPECKGPTRPAGLAATKYFRELLDSCTDLQVVTYKVERELQDKYGRYVALVTGKRDGRTVNLNELLLSSGHAEPYPINV